MEKQDMEQRKLKRKYSSDMKDKGSPEQNMELTAAEPVVFQSQIFWRCLRESYQSTD
jgi:hypothetical protein